MEEDTRDGMEKLESEPSCSDEDDGTESDDSDSKSDLRISITPEKTPDNTMTLRSGRKRKHSESDEAEEKIDRAIEEKLQDCAKKNNLSSTEMKKLIRKFVKNDHVLALVKIQEESELALESLVMGRQHFDDDDENSRPSNGENTETQDDVETPKFTRSTARALNKKPLPISVLSEIKTKPEVAALISEDLHSDEDDEEYHPRDEEESDDDPNTTVSDIDSQPCNPETPVKNCDQDEDIHERFTEDGLFKLPRERNDSTASFQEEIIAKRTRSKVCLQATSIETIESKFIPPDIPTDMYDFDCEMDQAWKDFLNEFSKPLNTNAEEDDEADPEYVAADPVKIDSEELRDVNISKKELSDLVAELFDGLVQEGVILEDIELEAPKKSPDKSPQKKRSKLEHNDEGSVNFTLNNESAFIPDIMSTPQSVHPVAQSVLDAPNLPYAAEPSSQDIEAVDVDRIVESIPKTNEQLSAPKRKKYVLTPQGYKPLVDVLDLTEPSMDELPSVITVDGDTDPIVYPFRATKRSYRIIPTIEPVVVPYSALTFNESTKSITQTMIAENYADKLNPSLNITTKSIRESMMEFYRKKYEQLRDIRSIEEPQFDEKQQGFTEWQRKVLDQQMRIHVQFIAQFFLQVYSHPNFWKHAETEKAMILELDKNNKHKSSAFNACNLKDAINLITEWEKELSIDSPENKSFMDFIHNEIDKVKRRTNYLRTFTRFPPRTMRRIVTSTVFIYGDLLPRMPFRPETLQKHELLPAVDQLIAHALHKVFNEMEEEQRQLRRADRRPIPITKVCSRIVRDHIFGKTPLALYVYIHKRIGSEQYNPIKFYFEHKKAPPYTHVVFDVDLNNLLPPEDRVRELPPVWQEFVNRLRALELEKTEAPQRYSQSLNSVRDYNDRPFDDCNINQVNNSTSNITIHLNYAPESLPKETYQPQQHSSPRAAQEIVDCEEVYHREQSICHTTNSRLTNTQTSRSLVCTEIHEPVLHQDNENPLDICNFSNNFVPEKESPNSCLSSSPNNFSEDFATEYRPPLVCQTSGPSFEEPSIIPSTARLPTSVNNAKEAATPPKESTVQKIDLPRGQKLVTDYFKVEDPNKKRAEARAKLEATRLQKRLHARTRKLTLQKKRSLFKKRLKRERRTIRRKQYLKHKIQALLTAYRRTFRALCARYKNENVSRVFRCVKALDIYADLLIDLKMNAKKMKPTEDGTVKKSTVQPKIGGVDEENPKPRKPYRVGESLRQMLLPESTEDTNEKDAVFAMNFFDKIEEISRSTDHVDLFRTFQKILKSFDPQKDRVADLYYKMENLFLPDYPDLAEVFLTFLVPAEAIEIGKFFEHFMITNMGSFINKLNIFFNKQPAQIKKIYGALNELADDKDVTVEQIKSKILPLLKGNKFLADWFLQTFETEKPNQSISSIYETVSYKQMESHQCDGGAYETLVQKDIVEESSENHPCQFKYINGGIFYGSRILLPAKLSFLATELVKCEEMQNEIDTPAHDNRLIGISNPCVHGIRDYAERRLRSHLDKSDEGIRNEDDSAKDKQTYTLCDDATFKVHAARLNPALYQSPPNHHTSNTLKSKSIDAERELKSSPKKQCNQKRRSPKKNLPKSPITAMKKSSQPSALLADSSKAISMAKKLKSLTSSGSNETDNSGPKTKRKQQKSQKTLTNEQLYESSGNQSSSDGATSDTDKSVSETKRKQSKLQPSLAAGDSLQLLQQTNTELLNNSSSASPVPQSGWTRDEDKIILEEVKSGFDNGNSLVSRLVQKLPHRTEIEIKHRHHFLMEVLTQLQGKVTS